MSFIKGGYETSTQCARMNHALHPDSTRLRTIYRIACARCELALGAAPRRCQALGAEGCGIRFAILESLQAPAKLARVLFAPARPRRTSGEEAAIGGRMRRTKCAKKGCRWSRGSLIEQASGRDSPGLDCAALAGLTVAEEMLWVPPELRGRTWG